jgi:hypothetical protein
MKKALLIAFAAIIMVGCTDKTMTRNFGSSYEVRLEKGQRLVEITWKNEDLWILTEPMDTDYQPQTKTFYEDSSWGLYEGKITIIESR